MSKRSRRIKDKNNVRPADARMAEPEAVKEARPADHSHEEPRLVVSGAAFQTFDAWIESHLDELVSRWIHTAAPAAGLVRRIVPEATRNKSA